MAQPGPPRAAAAITSTASRSASLPTASPIQELCQPPRSIGFASIDPAIARGRLPGHDGHESERGEDRHQPIRKEARLEFLALRVNTYPPPRPSLPPPRRRGRRDAMGPPPPPLLESAPAPLPLLADPLRILPAD